MRQLIKDASIVDDDWLLVSEDETLKPWPAGNIIVSLNAWQQNTTALSARTDVGVWIDGHADINDFAPSISHLPLIAIRFPTFMDGRGFSTARLLRERYQFKGELRAIGHFIRDQLCYLRRCGFTAFQLIENEDLDAALVSLNDFQDYYQAAVDQPLPLFRRRST